MKIGIDMDGVLCDFVKGYNALAKAHLNINLPYPAQTWNWHLDNGMTQAQADRLWEIIKTTTFHGTLLPLDGAIEAIERLNKLSHQGNDIYFITSRSGALAKFYAEMWLAFHGMDRPTVLIAKDKGPIAAGLLLDMFVDDLPDNIVTVGKASAARLYLIDHPYNQSPNVIDLEQKSAYGLREVYRVANLSAVLDIECPKEEKRAA